MSFESLLRLGGLSLLWGSGYLWIKLALQGLSPVQLGFGRLLAGATVLLMVAVVGRQRLPRLPMLWVHLAVMAMVANIAPFVLYGWGIERITSGLAAVLSATTPMFTLVATFMTRSEPPRAFRVLGLLLGFAGVVVLAAPWQSARIGGSPAGMAACLLGAACYGGSFVYARRFLTGRGFSSFMLSTGQMAMGAVLMALAAPVVARGRVTLAPIVITSVLVLGVLGTGVAYVLYYRLVADEGAVAASLVTYLVPPIAVVLGALVLHEPLTWNLLAGATIVLAGVAVAEGRLGNAVNQD